MKIKKRIYDETGEFSGLEKTEIIEIDPKEIEILFKMFINYVENHILEHLNEVDRYDKN